jgi:hypothetical protein
MLWNAGQERAAREQRARLAETFAAVRDAQLDVLVSTGQAKPTGRWGQPSYIEGRPEAVQSLRSPAERDAALARLGMMVPGMVRRRTH